MKAKKLGKLLDTGLGYPAVRIAQAAQKQGVPVGRIMLGERIARNEEICLWVLESGGRFTRCSETTTFIRGAHKWIP